MQQRMCGDLKSDYLEKVQFRLMVAVVLGMLYLPFIVIYTGYVAMET